MTTDANTGGSFNRYAYAANNPFKYIDPDGRQERAAEDFGDRFAKEAAAGNSDVYKPFVKPAFVVVGAAAVVSAVMVGPPLLAASQSLLAPAAVVAVPVAKELTKQELKSIGSLAKQAAKHEAKNAKFAANPTVRPGMENLPKAEIERQQAQRIMDTNVEIQKNFVDKIIEIIGK